MPVHDEVTILITLSDPCPTVVLFDDSQRPFYNMQYTLGRDAVTQSFEVKIALNTRVDCGIYLFEFIDESGNPLNPDYFSAPALST